MPDEEVSASAVQPAQSPVSQLPADDYGAETIRNFNYQFACGVVLLVAAVTRRNDYTAIWCEQEDDILAQADGNVFDGCQVKTQEPELGAWTVNDDPFVTAVKRFVALDRKYPGQMRGFWFLSNTKCLESDAKDKKHLCLKRLASAAAACSSHDQLPEAEKKGFEVLLQKAGGRAEELFRVLQRLGFVKMPSRESFIAELAQNHLGELDWCRLPQPRLEPIVRGLIQMVATASSLTAQDPARHNPARDGEPDPQLLAKRITVADFILRSRELAGPHFHYLPSLTTSPLAGTSKDLKRFTRKLHRGGLSDYADSLRNQTLSSEGVFLDLVTRGDEGNAQFTQIENVVRSECDEARLRAEQEPKPYGQRMLIDVQERLRKVATEEAHSVGKQPYEVLMGMVGLLTESCPVWWSEKFNVEEGP